VSAQLPSTSDLSVLLKYSEKIQVTPLPPNTVIAFQLRLQHYHQSTLAGFVLKDLQPQLAPRTIWCPKKILDSMLRFEDPRPQKGTVVESPTNTCYTSCNKQCGSEDGVSCHCPVELVTASLWCGSGWQLSEAVA
jgi:hypothetical protein